MSKLFEGLSNKLHLYARHLRKDTEANNGYDPNARERRVQSEEVHLVTCSPEMLQPEQARELQQQLEKLFFKKMVFSVDLPDFVFRNIQADHPEITTPENAVLFALSDTNTLKVGNAHGWNADRHVSRLNSAHPNKVDKQLQEIIGRKIQAIVLCFDLAGWGESEISEEGMLRLNYGLEAHNLKTALTSEMKKIATLLESIRKNENYASLTTESIQIIDQLESEVGRCSEHAWQEKKLTIPHRVRLLLSGVFSDSAVTVDSEQYAHVCDVLAHLSTHLNTLNVSSASRSLRDFIASTKSSIYHAILPIEKYLKTIPTIGKTKYTSHKPATGVLQFYRNLDTSTLLSPGESNPSSARPGTIETSTAALIETMSAFQMKGTFLMFPHSQAVRIFRRAQNRITELRKSLHPIDVSFIISDQMGASTARDLKENNSNSMLFEILRQDYGQFLLALGEKIRFAGNTLTSTIGTILTEYLGLQSKDSNLSDAVAREIGAMHGKQITFNKVALLLLQVFQWSKPDVRSEYWNAGLAYSGEADTLTPRQLRLEWKDSRLLPSSTQPHQQHFFHDPRIVDVVLKGAHYAQVATENQELIVEDGFRVIDELHKLEQLQEGITYIFGDFAPDLEISEIAKRRQAFEGLMQKESPDEITKRVLAANKLHFCLVSELPEETPPLTERITSYFAVAIQAIESNSSPVLKISVPLTKFENAALIAFMEQHALMNIFEEPTDTALSAFFKENKSINHFISKNIHSLFKIFPFDMVFGALLVSDKNSSEQPAKSTIPDMVFGIFMQAFDRYIQNVPQQVDTVLPEMRELVEAKAKEFIADLWTELQARPMHIESLRHMAIPLEAFMASIEVPKL